MAGGQGWASASWAGVPLRALRRAWERERVPAESGSERGSAPPSPPPALPPPAAPRRAGWAPAVFACCFSVRQQGAEAASGGVFQQRMRAASSSNMLGSLFGTPSARRQGAREGKVERRSSVTGEVEVVDVVTFKYDTGGAGKEAIVTLAAPAAAAGSGQGAGKREEEGGGEGAGRRSERGGGEGGGEPEGAGSGESSPGSGDEFHECVDELFEHPEELETEE